jgi:hypothetical protein
LYELASDPNEQVNLWGESGYDEQQQALQDLLESYLVTLPGKFPLAQ